MSKRLVWLAFAACAAVGFGVLGWFSREMLRLERESAEAQRVAGIEENIRLALWRMDSALASVHGLEAARPWQEYESFFRADTAYSRNLAPLPTGTIMLPSPLLAFTPPFVKLHFQIEADGTITSPQAPPPELRPSAITAGVPPERLDAASTALADLSPGLRAAEWTTLLPALPPADRNVVAFDLDAARDEAAPPTTTRTLLDKLNVRRQQQQETEKTAAAATAPVAFENAPVVPQPAPQRELQQQQLKSTAEQLERSNLLYAFNELNAEVAENRTQNFRTVPRAATSGNVAPADAPSSSSAPTTTAAAADGASRGSSSSYFRRDAQPPQTPVQAEAVADARQQPLAQEQAMAAEAEATPDAAMLMSDASSAGIAGPLQAVWLNGDLVLARRVNIGVREVVQGAWLDWSELQAWLLSRVADLLPDARLVAAPPGSATSALDAARRLAFLPVQLVPGKVSYRTELLPSPLRISLGAAWVSAVIGVVALALLLRGTIRLSERRGAFVSAVTHELRTPLTTFRMYTEMLSGGMVTDETKRRGYIDTLRKEAERLSHLVENVLSYARLERGRAASRVEDTTPAALLARCEERLQQRAQQGGLALRINFAAAAAELPLRTDTSAVDQILFNLVDNATKYGRPAGGEPGEISIDVARRASGGITIRVADRGPGIASSVRARLFRPFSKSATEAAHSQPGVGLGLALSRRLARDELHGELAVERTGPGGTTFCLEIPA